MADDARREESLEEFQEELARRVTTFRPVTDEMLCDVPRISELQPPSDDDGAA